MRKGKKNVLKLIFYLTFIININIYSYAQQKKLYWLILDGFRADTELFNIYKWAEQGFLPNIKKMMDAGSYGYCVPVFPTQSPACFASILTGTYPERHGVHGPYILNPGDVVNKPSLLGFSSLARNIPAIWDILKEKYKICLLSIPGSTPPSINDNIITIRGRWGLWGVDFSPALFVSKKNKIVGQTIRPDFYYRDKKIYKDYFWRSPIKCSLRYAEGWGEHIPKSYSPPLESKLYRYGLLLYLYIYDSIDDGKVIYDSIAVSLDKDKCICSLSQGEWSKWIAANLWGLHRKISSFIKIKLISISKDGDFRIYVLYNPLNETTANPPAVARTLIDAVGPMVDYPDTMNLVLRSSKDKETFLEIMQMSFDWHKRACKFIINNYNPSVFIMDGLAPNQMLTSRFWLPYVDTTSTKFNAVTAEQRKRLWKEIFSMYAKVDAIVGQLLSLADNNTIIVLSADHGMMPINTYVRINNLFVQKGLLVLKKSMNAKNSSIDWAKSRVILLSHKDIYINPDGFAKPWERPKGRRYKLLRDKVRDILLNLKDEHGINPFEKIVYWEDAKRILHLPTKNVGDLILVMKSGYCSGPPLRISLDRGIFSEHVEGGYKHALLAEDKMALWTPFVIMGPGIKKNYRLQTPIKQIDLCPTILAIMGESIPNFMQGKVIKEIMQ